MNESIFDFVTYHMAGLERLVKEKDDIEKRF